MRALPFLLLRLRAWLAPRRLLVTLTEIGLLAWAVVLLETVGRSSSSAGADLIGFLFGGLLAAGLVAAASAGFLPATRHLARRLGTAALRGVKRLDPPAGVAFRLPAAPSRPDRPRRLVTIALLIASAGALLAGEGLFAALTHLRQHVAYTPYLLALGLLWALFGTVTTIALLVGRMRPATGGRSRLAGRTSAVLGLWVAGVVGLAYVPGVVPLALVAGVALAGAYALALPVAGRYWLYRRDARGDLRAVTLHGYQRSYFALIAAFLEFVTALAQAPRLLEGVAPSGPFTLTLVLAISASVASLFLLVRVVLHVMRLLGPRGEQPEIPLRPTLWWPGGELQLSWVREARQRGWVVSDRPQPPRTGFDLVSGRDADPRRHLPPDPSLPDDEACFRLERRFHVVKRREFYRCFQSLFKQVTAQPRTAGCGYLFCPAARPVAGIIRDTAGAEPEDGARTSIGGMLVGRPYAAVFSTRLRRYLGGVLRALDLDLIYWEDRVRWSDLRRVFGVLFETYDQGRFPAQDRHFIGLPRVTVLVQAPEEADESYLEGPGEAVESLPPPLRARALVIRRDGGGGNVETPQRAPSSRRPEPVGA